MRKITLLIISTLSATTHAFTQENQSYVSDSLFEIAEKWKIDLLKNGKIYSVSDEKKAMEDYESGKNNYPVGLPTYLDASFDDINFDGKKDVLFHFYPIDILHGTGMIDQSDFGMLVCTNNNDIIIIDDITEIIKTKISLYYNDFRCYSVQIEFEGLRDGYIVGNFQAWVHEDAHCCPTFKNIFQYDYLRKVVKINEI